MCQSAGVSVRACEARVEHPLVTLEEGLVKHVGQRLVLGELGHAHSVHEEELVLLAQVDHPRICLERSPHLLAKASRSQHLHELVLLHRGREVGGQLDGRACC
jgi:hypothetical protein